MLIKYSSNNSGGAWWLTGADWKALEVAGWTVDWFDNEWLGGLAMAASKEFETPKQALEEFEDVTKQHVTDGGCDCCGPPHNFSWEEKGELMCASGEELIPILYSYKGPKTLREAYDKITGK